MLQLISRKRTFYLVTLLSLVMISSSAVSQTSESASAKEIRIEASDHEPFGATRGKDRRPKPILQAAASSDRIEPGESIQLDWRARFSPRGVLLLPGNKRLKKRGSILLTPSETTEYTLVAENRWGRENQSFRVVVENSQPDLSSPTQPKINNVISAGTEIQVDWQPSSDDHTPVSEIVYRIYIAESDVGGESDSFQLAGEVTGATGFSLETMQPNTGFLLSVLAIDSAGNESSGSEPIGIETGSRNVVLKQGITVVDLRGEALETDLELPYFLRVGPGSDVPEIETGDVLFVADNGSEYTLRVEDISIDSMGVVELRVNEISPFELIEEGDVKFKSNSDDKGANLDGEGGELGGTAPAMGGQSLLQSDSDRISYETEIGPLSLQTEVGISPRYEVSFSFAGGKVEEAEGNIHAAWDASLLTTLAASGATDLSEEFNLDVYAFTKTIPLKVGRLRLPVKVKLDTDVNGSGSIDTEGEAQVSVETTVSGTIDETVSFRQGEWQYRSQSSTPAYQAIPDLTAQGSAQGGVVITPTVILTVNRLFRQTATGSQQVDVELGAELVPNLNAVRQIFPEALFQPSKFDVTLSGRCTREGEILLPFVDDVSVYSETGCEEQKRLFSLPEVDLEKTGETCDEQVLQAGISDGDNNVFQLSSAQWFSYQNDVIWLGPTAEMEWVYLGAEDTEIIFSGHGILGENARRFWSTPVSLDPVYLYYIDLYEEDGLYAEGSTADEACQNLEALPGANDDGWDYMGVVGSQCYFAYGGVATELDMYVPVRRTTVCN